LTCDRYTLRGGALQQLKAAPDPFRGDLDPTGPGDRGRRHALTTAALLRSFFSLPLVTFKRSSPSRSLRRFTGKPCGSGSKARAWCRERMPRLRKLPFNTGLAIGKRADYTGTKLSAAGREPGSRESALVQ